MFAQVSGLLIEKQSTEVVVECGGIGYLLIVSLTTSSKLPEVGNQVKLKTLLQPREDQILLFGFFDDAERDLFKMLTAISGIGGKTAIGILSSVTPEELGKYIMQSNLISLQKLPGIGKKTAERLLIELRDKINKIDFEQDSDTGNFSNLHIRNEALSAMLTLGYNRQVAEKAIKKAIIKNQDGTINAETIIKDALRFAIE